VTGRHRAGRHRARRVVDQGTRRPGAHRAGAHRAPTPTLAPRVASAAVVAALAGATVITTAPWRDLDARAAGSTPGTAVAAAGFAAEPRVQAGSSRGAQLRPGVSAVTAVSLVAAAGRSVARELPAALDRANRSVGAGLETTSAGTGAIALAALREAHHPPILAAHRTSSYGMRWGRLHRGIDYGADWGTPLYAVAQGTVTAAGWTHGLGYHVKLTLPDGTVLVYGHLSRVSVSEGQSVVPGQKVGEVGSSGTSTGAHLHFEVRVDGVSINPDPWLQKRLGDRHLAPPRD
jgi:murein DD-endopeptidase MepM/ murein hydrolase activator NlpD